MWKIANRNFPYLTETSVLFAVAITFLNDHYFKYQYPGFIVGKLSDFAGIYYAPFFMYALISFFKNPVKNHLRLQPYFFLASVLIVDFLFVVLKVTDLRIWFVDFFSRYFFRIKIVQDWTDLFALAMNCPTYLVARKYFITESV
ncbi:MAG: hypothetical protein H7256_00075 [Bdellovibrio sp.]|nr:hypothetical protein [Bdellovibrio sp.]